MNTLEHAEQLARAGRYAEARALAQRALARDPHDAEACTIMCFALAHEGQRDAALYYARKAAAKTPDNPAAQANFASALSAVGSHEDAIAAARRARELDAPSPFTRGVLCNVLSASSLFVSAAHEAREGLALAPSHTGLASSLAFALTSLGQADDAALVLRAALADNPHELSLLSTLCGTLTYCTTISRTEFFTWHRAYDAALHAAAPITPEPFTTRRDPHRPLTIGLVTPDLKEHAVGFFMRALLDHADRAAFNIIAYSLAHDADRTAARDSSDLNITIRPSAWISELDLYQRIRADNVDILLDLCGHSSPNRVALAHLRPAPVQINYCGYPATSGLSSLDARLIDSITDPPAAGEEALHSERLVRIDPCFLCYTPMTPLPPPAPITDRPPIFGTFNALPKLNDPLLALYARVLSAAPGSRLVLKNTAMKHAEVRDHLAARCTAAGIAADRLDLVAPAPSRGSHLQEYRRIDIALDSTPYAGATTTCEALAMGVPVITLAGDRHVSRAGMSILSAAGLPELIAQTPDDFVALAARLAHDRAALTQLRTGMRERVLGSSLCDRPAFADRFSRALRSCWIEHCRST